MVSLDALGFGTYAVLRDMTGAGVWVTAEEVCDVAGAVPGALRFLDGAGGAVLGSGLTEKLDMPGRWSFWTLGSAALLFVGGAAGAVVDERRVLAADDLSPSAGCALLGMEGAELA